MAYVAHVERADQTARSTPRCRICLGFPSGGNLWLEAAKTLFLSSFKHDVEIVYSTCSGGNFNRLWCQALNEAAAGKWTHFAMLHADLAVAPDDKHPGLRWLDVLVEELDKHDGDLISVAAAIKDARGMTSSGILNNEHEWPQMRQFSVRELARFPETWNAESLGFPGWYTAHNDGCWLADLRKPVWRKGGVPPHFEFRERIVGAPGKWAYQSEGEDYYFSRQLHERGARTFVTRRVKLLHLGSLVYPNFGDWGTEGQENQEETKELPALQAAAGA